MIRRRHSRSTCRRSSRAAALVLTYRAEAELVPAYVRSVERWLATAAR